MNGKFLHNLHWAQLCDPPFRGNPIAHSVSTRAGLAYEKKVAEAIIKSNRFPPTSIARNPWFQYADDFGEHYCSPDLLISLVDGSKIVVEVKLTYKLEAEVKLKRLYFPVVSLAFRTTPGLLVVAKKLTPEAPEPMLLLSGDKNLYAAPLFDSRVAVVQWVGKGAI